MRQNDKVLVIEVEAHPESALYTDRAREAVDHFWNHGDFATTSAKGDGWRWFLREPSASEAPSPIVPDATRFRGLLADLQAAAFEEGRAQAQVDEAREVVKDTLAALERLLGGQQR